MRKNIFLCGLACALSVVTGAMAGDETGKPVTRHPSAAGDGVDVGIARRDGVTVSGGEAFVTRNGVTEKLVKDLKLPSGIMIRPDGTLKLSNHSESALQADQLLTLDGRVVTIPNDPNVNPAPPMQRAPAQTAASGQVITSTSQAGPGGNGSVFLSANGTPFMGTVTSPGAITTGDNVVIPIDGSIRAVSFGAGGAPSLGRLNPNGTITTSSGTTIFPDGSVRAANGTVISSATPGMGAAVSPSVMNSLGLTSSKGGTTQQAAAAQNGTTQQGAAAAGTGTPQGFVTPQGATQSQFANPQANGTQSQFTNPSGNQSQFVTPQGATTTGQQGSTTQPATGNQFRNSSPGSTGQGGARASGTGNGSAGGAVNGGAGAGQGAHGGGGAR